MKTKDYADTMLVCLRDIKRRFGTLHDVSVLAQLDTDGIDWTCEPSLTPNQISFFSWCINSNYFGHTKYSAFTRVGGYRIAGFLIALDQYKAKYIQKVLHEENERIARIMADLFLLDSAFIKKVSDEFNLCAANVREERFFIYKKAISIYEQEKDAAAFDGDNKGFCDQPIRGNASRA